MEKSSPPLIDFKKSNDHQKDNKDDQQEDNKDDQQEDNKEDDKQNSKIKFDKLNFRRIYLPFLNKFLIDKLKIYLKIKDIINLRNVCYSLKKNITEDDRFWYPYYHKLSTKKIRDKNFHEYSDGYSFELRYNCLSESNKKKYPKNIFMNSTVKTDPNFFYLCSIGSHGRFIMPEINWNKFKNGNNYFNLIIEYDFIKKKTAKGKNSITNQYIKASKDYNYYFSMAESAKIKKNKWQTYFDKIQKEKFKFMEN